MLATAKNSSFTMSDGAFANPFMVGCPLATGDVGKLITAFNQEYMKVRNYSTYFQKNTIVTPTAPVVIGKPHQLKITIQKDKSAQGSKSLISGTIYCPDDKIADVVTEIEAGFVGMAIDGYTLKADDIVCAVI